MKPAAVFGRESPGGGAGLRRRRGENGNLAHSSGVQTRGCNVCLTPARLRAAFGSGRFGASPGAHCSVSSGERGVPAIIGEPVFLVLDLVNAGLQAVRVDDSACWTSIQFDVPNASEPQGVSLYGCALQGSAGSCGSGLRDLRPGEHLNRRFLVGRSSRVDAPGIYWAHVEHTANM